MRVLVADDDRILSLLICSLLRARGHEAMPAMDAMQTITEATRAPVPDIIVLDLNMPGGHGVDILRQLKESPMTAKVPVVVLSGEGARAGDLMALGAAAFLRKPVEPDVLFGTLSDAVGRAV